MDNNYFTNGYQQYQPYTSPYGQGGAFAGYAQPAKTPNFKNPLGDEKVKELLARGNLSKAITISEEDFNQALCNHHYNNQSMLEQLNDGSGKVRCKICGEEFTVVDGASVNDIIACVDNIINIWNTIKFANADIPLESCSDFYSMLAYIKKTPQVYKSAIDNINQYCAPAANSAYGTNNGFAILGSIMGMPSGAPMYAQQPYMGYQQPAYTQTVEPYANAYNPAAQAMQAQAPGQSNGFGYTAPAPAPAPVQQPQPYLQQPGVAPAQTPVQPAPAPVQMPQAGAPTADVRINKQLTT